MPVITLHARTCPGLVRHSNEDHILAGRYIKNSGSLSLSLEYDDSLLRTQGMLLAVADGIGGHRGGAMASKIALTVLERDFYSVVKESWDIGQLEVHLREIAQRANEAVLRYAASNPEYANMGCTLSAFCLFRHAWFIIHAGDSRVYRYRNGFAKFLTIDDTLAALADKTGPSAGQKNGAVKATSTLTNYLGKKTMQAELNPGPQLKPGDRVLICSDGLYNEVDHDKMELIFQEESDISRVAARLEKEAMDNGGRDNISVAIAGLDKKKPGHIKRNGGGATGVNETDIPNEGGEKHD